MSKKLRLLLLVREAMLLASCWPFELPTAGDHDDDHHYRARPARSFRAMGCVGE
jgi:hypothetical protein